MDSDNLDGFDKQRGSRLEQAFKERQIAKTYVLAMELGVSESAVSRWKQGASITLNNARKLCLIVDISMDWLVLGRGGIDDHKRFTVSRSEREFLQKLRSAPEGFREHLKLAIDHLKTPGA